MQNYKKMYYELFNKITYVIEELKVVQQETEEIYIQDDETKNLAQTNNTD